MSRSYKYITSRTSPNRSSRKGHKVASITVHWWGNPVGQKIGGIVDWLCNPRAGASAHYVVSGDTVYCIVDPDQKAWHSGSNRGNLTSIGLELDPNASMRASTEKTAAALIADLRAHYGNLPLRPHSSWVSTACPGNWDLGRLDSLSKAGSGAKLPVGGSTAAPLPSKPKAKKAPLKVDGRWGTKTTKALQRFLNKAVDADVVVDGRMGPRTWRALQVYLNKVEGSGIYLDGLIENQSYRHTELGNGISPNGWEYTGRRSKGSKTIRGLQRHVGAGADGVLYEGTTAKVQTWLNKHGAKE